MLEILPSLPALEALSGKPNPTWTPLIAVLGLVLGSFLNVVISRGAAKYLPHKYQGKLTVSEPKHSFCPECLHPLSWKENIPLVSYILQRGRCLHCGCQIPYQYPLVEALTAALLATLWLGAPSLHGFLTTATLTIFLIPVAGIDIKTLRVPNKITIGGTLLCLALAGLPPQRFQPALLGAVTGFGFTYLLVELGKLLFGKKTVTCKEAKETLWKNNNLYLEEPGIALEETEPTTLEELFTRPSDQVVLDGTFRIQDYNVNTIIIDPKGITLPAFPQAKFPHETPFHGKTKTFTFPREAMGMGDAKIMMMVGAALGPMATIHTLTAAAILAMVLITLRRIVAKLQHEKPPTLIAFGPWIAGAAILLMVAKWP